MRTFCSLIQKSIWEKCNIDVDVFVPRKKKLVHFAFKKPFLSIPLKWKKRRILFQVPNDIPEVDNLATLEI